MSLLKYLKFNKEILINSFKKINLSLFLLVIIDYVYYGLVYQAFKLWNSKLLLKYNSVQVSPATAAIQDLLIEAKGLYYFIIYSLILLGIAIFIISVFAKGIIWALTTKTKIAISYILRFAFAKLIWNLLFLAFVIFSFIMLKPNAAIIFATIFIIISIYFSNIFYALFTKSQKIAAIKRSIIFGLKKAHFMLLPYAIITAIGFLIIRAYPTINNKFWMLLNIATLFHIAVSRYYLSTLVLEVENRRK